MLTFAAVAAGWVLLAMYLAYEYRRFGTQHFRHLLSPSHHTEIIFHVVFLLPLAMTVAALLLDRKERALRRALGEAAAERARAEDVLEGIGEAISIQDRDMTVVYQNRMHKERYGEHVGETCYEVYAGVDRVCEGCPVAATLMDGRYHLLEKSAVRDGRTMHLEIAASPLRNAGGDVIAGIEVVRDITERRLAEEELVESRRLYRDLVEYTDAVHWELDMKTMAFTYVSPQAERLLGYPVTDWTDFEFWAGHIHPEDREWAPRFFQERTRRSEDHQFTYRMVAADGGVVWIRDIVNVISGPEGPEKLRGLMIDVTAQKKMQAQLLQAQKMEAVGQMVGGIAHDFNNTLTAIIGFAEILQNDMSVGAAERKYLHEILAAGERANSLIDGLLTFSRRQVTQVRGVDVNDMVRGMKSLLERLIGEDVRLKFSVPEGLLVVMADRVQLEQVLMNLAVNARAAMPRGGTLFVGVERAELDEEYVRLHGYGAPGAYALLSVSDTGEGMDEATKERIFEPFFTTKEAGKGTGLGLATAYGIVKEHEGYINVYSEVGMGTTFKTYLPLAENPEGRETVQDLEVPLRGSETILVAEDNAAVRALMETALGEYGYNIVLAHDGEDTLQKFKEQPDRIDLLILDVIMPKRNGQEAYEAIRGLRPDMPTLFVSGYTADVMRARGAPLGEGVHFLPKPVCIRALLKTVRGMLDGRK
jgi:PAS domain S-box-containing protein